VRRIICLLVLLSSLQGWSQQYFFKQFAVSEGLAQSTVFKVIQDRNDIYWLGTQAGVSSFNGGGFSNYSSSDGLSENGVRAICEDRNGRIWFGHTGGGVSRYVRGEFESVKALDTLISSHVTSILEDSAGTLWITTLASGVIRVMNPAASSDSLQFRQYSGSEISDRVFSGYINPGGDLFFVSDPTLKLLQRDSTRFVNANLKGVPRYHATTCILQDSGGDLWIGKHNGGLFRYDPGINDSRMYDLIKAGLGSNWVSTLFEDRSGNIWAGTWGGGLAMITKDDRITAFGPENGLPGEKIWDINQDREMNVLVGTQEHGLCVYKGDHFISFSEENGLAGSQVSALLESRRGDMWFGTEEGISIFSGEAFNGTFRDLVNLKEKRVNFLKEDSHGTIWIGTQDNGVFSHRPGGRIVFDPVLNNNIYNLHVTAMDLDGQNNLWVGTLEGLVYYEIDRHRVDRLSQVNGLQGSDISAVFSDSENRIWVGSAGRGITMIQGSNIDPVELGFSFTPRCFAEDRDGRLWIGTEGRGVLVYDPETNEIVNSITVADGLLANLINLLSCDNSGRVYIGTNKGLNICTGGGEHIYSFTHGGGFVGIETRPNATTIDRKGHIWFGTVAGATRFAPPEEGIPVEDPLTHITGFLVNHEPMELREGTRLSHKQNSIIFEYRCITLNPDAVLYQIMLEGVDSEWRPPDPQSRVTYPALRHGKYRFLVRGRNSEGVWNDVPVYFSFEIRPPVYLTWYFILSMVLAAALLVFGYIKYRERALRRENAILEEKVKDRTATVVSQKEELAQKNKDITDSIRYAKRIQFAILPEDPPFPDTFVLFKPKAIVSGDFYWFQKVNGREYFSAVDCTGHGVPGAFMSIIGHNSLNKIVREYGILEPGEILTRLNREVVDTLNKRRDAGDVLDGMDLALACYIPEERSLEFAGAFNPLYLVRDGKLHEIKADKVSIGRSSATADIRYATQKTEIRPGDAVYLFSDGYADQFGGDQMKKFKYRNLKELILRIRDESMSRQREILDETIENWKGDIEQLDDILVVGRRF